MSEENKNEFEEQEVLNEEAVEEIAEETEVTEAPAEEEVVEEVTEETTQETAETEVEDEAIEPEVIAEADVAEVKPDKNSQKTLIAGIVCALVIVVAIVVLILNWGKLFNKYNRKYIDTTGRTVGEVADLMGYDYADFLADYGLPSDMPENTYESAAVYSMSLEHVASQYGMTVDDIKEMLGLGDDVTGETTWGDAQDQATLAKFVGEEALEEFKAEYGFGDEVTAETKWGEVREKVDQFQRDQMLEEKKAAEEAEKAAKTDDGKTDDEESSVVDDTDADTKTEEKTDSEAKAE